MYYYIYSVWLMLLAYVFVALLLYSFREYPDHVAKEYLNHAVAGFRLLVSRTGNIAWLRTQLPARIYREALLKITLID